MKKNFFVSIFGPIGLFPKTYKYFKIYNSLCSIDEEIFITVDFMKKKCGVLNLTAVYSDINNFKKFCIQLHKLILSYHDRGKITDEHYSEIIYKYKQTRENINLYKRYVVDWIREIEIG